jgi:hypothetical protein
MFCRIPGWPRTLRYGSHSLDLSRILDPRHGVGSGSPVKLSAIWSRFRLNIVRSAFHQFCCVFFLLRPSKVIWERTFAEGDEAMKVTGMQLRETSRRIMPVMPNEASSGSGAFARPPQLSVASRPLSPPGIFRATVRESESLPKFVYFV